MSMAEQNPAANPPQASPPERNAPADNAGAADPPISAYPKMDELEISIMPDWKELPVPLPIE